MPCYCVLAIVKSPLAGDFVVLECKKLMEELNVEVVPPFMIASKVSDELNSKIILSAVVAKHLTMFVLFVFVISFSALAAYLI